MLHLTIALALLACDPYKDQDDTGTTPATDTDADADADTDTDTDSSTDESTDTETDTDTDTDTVPPDVDDDGDGFSEDEGDCDDTDDSVFPAAAELCDGQQNDCDDTDWTSDDGLATFIKSDGEVIDMTATLKGAVASSLDTNGALNLCAGTWDLNLTALADIDIIGIGIGDVTIDGDGGRILLIDGSDMDVTLSNLTLTGGVADAAQGGAVYCTGDNTLSISSATLEDNTAEYGGALALYYGCDTTLVDVTLSDNVATDEGGAIYLRDDSDLTVTGDSSISNNRADQGGGGLSSAGVSGVNVVTMSGTNLANNSAGYDASGTAIVHSSGGGMSASNTDLYLTDVTFSGNLAANDGGAISTYTNASVNAELKDCTFQNNAASSSLTGSSHGGGAISVVDSNFIISGTDFLGNTAEGGTSQLGGAIFLADSIIGFSSSSFGSNDPDDLFIEGPDLNYSWASYSGTCSESGCSE